MLETSQFTWWIGQICLVTLYRESPLDLLLLASLSPATIFRFLIPLWPGDRISPDRGNHWHPDTKAYTATEAYTKILEIKPAAAPPARFVQGIEFRSSYCPSFIQVYYAPDRKLICEEQKKGKDPKTQ